MNGQLEFLLVYHFYRFAFLFFIPAFSYTRGIALIETANCQSQGMLFIPLLSESRL